MSAPNLTAGERITAYYDQRAGRVANDSPQDPPSRGKLIRYVVDDGSPIALADAFIAARYTEAGEQLLARYLRESWAFSADLGHYGPVDDEDLTAQIRAFLDVTGARHIDESGEEHVAPVRVTQRQVAEVAAALNDDRRPRVSADARLPFPLAGYTGPSPKEIIVVRNGLLDLGSGKLYPPTPRLFATAGSAAAYDPYARCPEWEAFLTSVFSTDEEAIRLLRQWFGYLLTTDTSQQKLLLLVGERRSGKGTIARVKTELLGPGNVAAPTLSSLQNNFGLAPLVGKPLAIVGDARLGGRADQATITERLLSISGEDMITVDRKHKPAIDVRLRTRILLISNELPRLTDASGALASRFSILETRQSFLGREDLGLERRLLAELPGILNWAIEGWRDLRNVGRFVEPSRSQEAREDLEALTSPIRTFVADVCDVGAGREVAVDDLYQAYRAWCEKVGRREPGELARFGRDLRSAFSGIDIAQRRTPDGKRRRFYIGIGIAS